MASPAPGLRARPCPGAGVVKLVLRAFLLMLMAASAAMADTAAANQCAESLSPDAKTIFNATLPKVNPGANLRSLLTSSTRSLAFSGEIDVGSARQSATDASKCLQMAMH